MQVRILKSLSHAARQQLENGTPSTKSFSHGSCAKLQPRLSNFSTSFLPIGEVNIVAYYDTVMEA